MWIRVDTGLCDHPKVIALSQALKLDKDAVVGKLLRLWSWAAQNRENGVLRAYDVDTIAEIMRVRTNAKKLIDALCAIPNGYQNGFIEPLSDGGYALHDWQEYAGKSVEERNASRNRMRKMRERYANDRNANDATSSDQLQQRYIDVTRNIDVTSPEQTPQRYADVTRNVAEPTYTVHNNPPIVPPQGDERGADSSSDLGAGKYPTAFEAFWAAYPRKVGKGAALKAWRRISAPASALPAMLTALEWQRESEQWQRDGGQYIPHPATWLNQSRWEDERPDTYGPYDDSEVIL